MNGNTELLNFIYQNSQMGVDTLEKLLELTEDAGLKRQLEAQRGEYGAIHAEARRLLNQNGCDEKGLGKLERLRTYLTLQFETLRDKSPSHIAEMLITGGTMGIVSAARDLNRYADAEPEIRALMSRLLEFEERSGKELRAFL